LAEICRIRRFKIQGQPWANSSQDLIFKTTRTNWTGDVAQVVECLLYKCKALSSTPVPQNKTKQKQQQKTMELWIQRAIWLTPYEI
jgi:hypothetical protein